MSSKNGLISILPSIENLTTIKGFPRGFWISIVGEPASCKSLISTIAMYNWLTQSEKNAVICILFENGPSNTINQAISLGFDLRPFEKANRLLFTELTDPSKRGENSFTYTVDTKRKIIRDNLGGDAEIFLVVDGIASMWEDKPAMASKIWTYITAKCDSMIDLAFVTIKIANTDKAFGVGAEFGSDVIIRVGKSIDENYEGKRWIYLDKFRNTDHDRKMREMIIKGKEVFIGNPISREVLYTNPIAAMEGKKYNISNNIQQMRNDVLQSIDEQLKKLTTILTATLTSFQKEIINLKKEKPQS